ncbi:hypothetical protein A0J48_018615, partial [Sphaerospermopsis aphanizomenoides BCCUSP55]|uniref:hypothetical protein n=1 Tax=Sphaerospermopsis aphanizomenoides TaxID=459663 RepID=UPI0019039531
MKACFQSVPKSRYKNISEQKIEGSTYTPEILADFVAEKIVDIVKNKNFISPIKILDPAVGDGQLLVSLLK